MSPDERTNFDRTRQLGEALANDLDDVDVLGRWMAHHISDLITRADATNGPDGEAIREEASDTILKLWNHRATAPLRSNPTHNMDIVIQALERLENTQAGRFYQTFRSEEAPDQNTIASLPALRLALDLEENIRDIVIQVLRFAADEAENKEAPWIQATEHLAEDSQRSIWRLMRQVDRRRLWRQVSTYTDADEPSVNRNDDATDEIDDIDFDNKATHVLASLRYAEARLAKICSAIERAIGPNNTS